MNCRNCEYDKLHTDYFSGDQYHFCKKHLDNIDPNKANICKDYKAKTRGDKIRSMTDEELTNFFLYDDSDFCQLCEYNGTTCDGYGCRDAMIKWIKQPAEG